MFQYDFFVFYPPTFIVKALVFFALEIQETSILRDIP